MSRHPSREVPASWQLSQLFPPPWSNQPHKCWQKGQKTDSVWNLESKLQGNSSTTMKFRFF